MLIRKKSNALTENSHCKFLLSDCNTWALFNVHVWISKQHQRDNTTQLFLSVPFKSYGYLAFQNSSLTQKLSSMAIPPKPW